MKRLFLLILTISIFSALTTNAQYNNQQGQPIVMQSGMLNGANTFTVEFWVKQMITKAMTLTGNALIFSATKPMAIILAISASP